MDDLISRQDAISIADSYGTDEAMEIRDELARLRGVKTDDDCISRQAAIDAMVEAARAIHKAGDEIAFRMILAKVPQVQPERKRGKWIYDRPHHWKCSECGSMWGEGHRIMNYCPVCGADMGGGEDGEDS